ncbi:hypothetical protein PRK78_005269 [Emydomyces testavorans]|uniref:ABC transporter domain-containing protein n=1 Tax=Emydomyces testavorans TaxID=2070801 RepID=A0AAF0IMG3_9EURO|nr:hypothetical protein PRK78_005269 [Emydomyces testavorans]
MAEKLIPGIPEAVKIAILQQTDAEGPNLELTALEAAENDQGLKTVLQQVLGSDQSRNDIVRKMNILSHAFEESEDKFGPIRAVRQLEHERLEQELFLAQKNAALRSGARGLQARKELKVAEGKVSESANTIKQSLENIDSSIIQEETKAAVEMLDELQTEFEPIAKMNIVDREQEARKILLGLGFKEPSFDQPFHSLSGGWRVRCMLAGVLIQSADIMILDEPTNFLDLLGVIWLETYLKRMRDESDKTVVVVSHDRDFLNAVCEEVIILKDQTLTYFKGNISAYEQDLEAQKLFWGRMKEAQDRQTAHMKATIRENIKVGKKTGDDNKLRMAKSRQKKLEERTGVEISATGGRFKLSRDRVGWHDSLRAEIEVPADEKGVTLEIPDAPDLRFPGALLSLEAATFRYRGKETSVLNGIDLVIHMGDRVGVMGLNGCGKTTLLNVLVGVLEPSQGKVSHHPRLRLGYYSQHTVEDLQELGESKPELTALLLMLQEAEGELSEGDARGLLSSLGLVGSTASDVQIAQLSGGQLVRLALARILWKRPHLLILDEITTHLDFHTVLALSSALSTFNGAILLVSHDRFLVRTVIEGKHDTDEEDNGAVTNIEDEGELRRRHVFVLRAGKLHLQEDGVKQFEQSLETRVRKLMMMRRVGIQSTHSWSVINPDKV